MAEGCVENISDKGDKNYMFVWDADVSNHILVGNIAFDKIRLSWSNNYELLKETIESTFEQRGKWCSPGGSAKRFDSDVSDFQVTWYPGKLNSLTFNGKLGEKARNFLVNLCEATSMSIEPRESTHTSNEPNRYDRLLDELIEVKQSVANMSSAMNKLYDHVAFTVNYIYNQDLTSNKTVSECGIQTDIYPISTDLVHIVEDTLLRNTVCEIGTQTDVKQVNDNLTQNKVKEHIPSSFYELSTDLEGTKLDIVIMERRITSEVRENGQAIELMLKQNSTLSDKVNSLGQGLEKLEANLHKIEPKHVSDHPNQRSVHTKAKITKGHVAINNKGLSGKLNPDTNNNQNHGHPSTSLKITHKPVFEENRVTTSQKRELMLKQNSALSDKVNSLSQGLEKLEANLHKIEPKHVSDHPNQRSVHTKAKITKGHVAINNKGLSGKLNPDTNNNQNHGHPSTSLKITHKPVFEENRVTTSQKRELMLKQNSALSDKVNSLSQGLEKLEANLHKIEPKHVSDHPNQRSVHTKAKITKGHVAINNKGLSGKLNPDTNNNQNHGHPSISPKITHKPVFEENRVTTPRSAPPEWLKYLPLCDIPYDVSCNNPTNISVTKHKTNLIIHQHQDGLEQLSNNSKHINDIINNKRLSGKSNSDTVNNSQNYGYPSISQKTTCRPVNGEIRVPTSRPTPPEWLKSLPLINTPYNDSSNNPVFRGIYGRRKTRWRSRREKNSVIAN